MGQDSLKPAFSKTSFSKLVIEYLQLSQAIILSLGLFYITDVSWVSSFTNGNIIISSLMLFQLIWLVFSWRWYSQQDWFNLYTIFLIACFCFNASQSTLFLFGLLDKGILDYRFSDVHVIQSLYFVLVSFSWLHLGTLLGWGYASQQCGCIGHINITYSSIRFVSILLYF